MQKGSPYPARRVNLAAGLAIIVISPAQSELNRIIERYNVGYIVGPGDHIKLAGYIRLLADDQATLGDFKRRSLDTSRQFTSANAGAYPHLRLVADGIVLI